MDDEKFELLYARFLTVIMEELNDRGKLDQFTEFHAELMASAFLAGAEAQKAIVRYRRERRAIRRRADRATASDN